MTPRLWIDTLTFSDGSQVTFDKSDVVVIVGSNNAGKSATLRAIRDRLINNTVSPVLTGLTSIREGSDQDVVEWLDSFTRKNDPYAPDPVFQALGAGVHKSQVNSYWQGQNALQGLSRFFCHLLTADERLQTANPPQSFAVVREPPTHPIHFLVRDEALEARLSDRFCKAFGVDLVVNRLAGSQVPLHVGKRPIPQQGQDRLTFEYVKALEELPLLHTQGDGMRSFAGVILYTSVGRESLLMIDEPEAFLHPPQARHLGKTLVTDKPDERQLFVATHSGDILRGVLDSGSTNVRILRVRREGAVNHIREIANDKVAELWSDPLLRYSNILDGLFHEKVIVCEGDADARFYSAVADATVDTDEAVRRPEAMFTHCGGKDRVAMVVRALRQVDVPVAVAVDFDVLNSTQPLRTIVEALGGEWDHIANDWRLVKDTIDAKKPELDAKGVRSGIEEILDGIDTGPFPKAAKDEIQRLFKRSSPWATAKDVGRQFIPAGDPTQAFERLMTSLQMLGLFVVEVGEMECFVKSVGNHGPRWVNEVLKKDLKSDPELDGARRYVRKLTRTAAN